MRQVLKSKKITSPPVIHEFLEFHINFDLFIISCPLPIVHETHETFIFKVLGANNLVLGKLGPGQSGPGQLGPICHFFRADSWAPGPNCPGPNLPRTFPTVPCTWHLSRGTNATSSQKCHKKWLLSHYFAYIMSMLQMVGV